MPKKYFNVNAGLLSLILLFAGLCSAAQEQLDDTGPEGYLWYNEKQEELKTEEEPVNPANNEDFAKRAAAARAANDRDRQHFEDAVQIAIADPTMNNIMYAHFLQKQTIDRAAEFGKKWVTAPLLRPELLQGALHEDAAFQYEQEKKEIAADNLKLNSIAEDWGGVFSFARGCLICPPIITPLQQLREGSGIQIIAVSDD